MICKKQHKRLSTWCLTSCLLKPLKGCGLHEGHWGGVGSLCSLQCFPVGSVCLVALVIPSLGRGHTWALWKEVQHWPQLCHFEMVAAGSHHQYWPYPAAPKNDLQPRAGQAGISEPGKQTHLPWAAPKHGLGCPPPTSPQAGLGGQLAVTLQSRDSHFSVHGKGFVECHEFYLEWLWVSAVFLCKAGTRGFVMQLGFWIQPGGKQHL